MQIPGVDWLVAAVLIAENRHRYEPVPQRLVSGLLGGRMPRQPRERRQQQKSRHARKGNLHLRTMLVGAASSAGHAKGSYLKDRRAAAPCGQPSSPPITCSLRGWHIAISQPSISTRSASGYCTPLSCRYIAKGNTSGRCGPIGGHTKRRAGGAEAARRARRRGNKKRPVRLGFTAPLQQKSLDNSTVAINVAKRRWTGKVKLLRGGPSISRVSAGNSTRPGPFVTSFLRGERRGPPLAPANLSQQPAP